MLVRFQGFTFYSGSSITQKDFIEYLKKSGSGDDGGEFEFAGKKRLFYFSDSVDSAYYVGLLITIKNHKRFCALQSKNGKKKILVSEVALDNDLMDFNYFIINKNTHSGIYQHYHQSCGINQFGYFLKLRYESLKAQLIESEIKVLQAAGSSIATSTKKTNEKYKGSLRFSQMYRKENIEQLFSELARISAFDFDVYSIDVKEPTFTPLSKYATKVHKHVVFDRNASLDGLLKGIKTFIKQEEISNGRIKGYDAEGIVKFFDLVNTPDYFYEIDFDELVAKLQNVEIHDLANNWVVKQLLATAKTNKHLFEVADAA